MAARLPRNRSRDALVTVAWVTLLAGLASLISGSPTLAQVTGVLGTIVALIGVEVARQSNQRRSSDAPPPSVSAADLAMPDRSADEVDDDAEASAPAGPGDAPPADRLLSAEFLDLTLRGRVSAAKRALRPLSLVCFESTEAGHRNPAVSAEAVAAVLDHTLRESDIAGRLVDGIYVCVLEDTGEDGAVWAAERIRQNLVAGGPRRFRAGVASYPNHGLESDELLSKATAALAVARDWTRDRIEVATSP